MGDEIGIVERKLEELRVLVAGVDATLHEFKNVSQRQFEALFDYKGQHDARLRTVETNYLPRATFDAHVAKNDSEHKDYADQLRRADRENARLSGRDTAVLAILQLLGMGGVAALMKFFGT